MTQTAEKSHNIVDGLYKDSSPMATVNRIKGILNTLGLEVQERWFESGVPYCYSNKISIPGTTFGTIGKGLTKEFAIASAYGEMIERLQVGFIYGPTSLKDGDFAIDSTDNEMSPAAELLSRDRIWYERLSQTLFECTGIQTTPEQILSNYTTQAGMVNVTPFFDLVSRQKACFPTVLRKRLYGSNGCAAGNTPEEALVQAISEIVERHHKIKIISEGIGMYEIPDEVLSQYKVSFEIIQFVRNNGYKLVIKDASLGTGFPVVCACIIDRKTGRYHTHFGAHPVMEIALERSLTESFQGRSISAITTNEDFSPKSDVKFSINAFYAELRRSSGNKLPSFFVDEGQHPFDPNMGVHTCDNKEILRYCVDYFGSMGHPLLVRDYSCLGFPTYQVIVPGYSECYINRITEKTDDQFYAPYAIKTLRDPSKATMQDMLGTLLHLDRLKMLDSKFTDIHNFSMLTKTPSKVPLRFQKFLMAASLGYVFFTMKQYRHAAIQAGTMSICAQEKDLPFLLCLKRYLTMKAEGYDGPYIRKTLTYFHEEDIVSSLISMLGEKKNLFSPFILHCDKKCSPACQVYEDCFLQRVDSLAATLDNQLKELDFDASVNYLNSIL